MIERLMTSPKAFHERQPTEIWDRTGNHQLEYKYQNQLTNGHLLGGVLAMPFQPGGKSFVRAAVDAMRYTAARDRRAIAARRGAVAIYSSRARTPDPARIAQVREL